MDPPQEAEPTIVEETIGKARTPIACDHDEKYGVPTLEELGFETETLKQHAWIGGETEALGNKLKFTINLTRVTYNVIYQC
jgi:cryptochrome